MTERKTYYLDLQTLLTVLHNKAGMLTAKITVKGQAGTGTISLNRGKISSCVIEWPGGHIEGDDAFTMLKDIKEWQVHFQEPTRTTTHSLSPTTPLYNTGSYPQSPNTTPKSRPTQSLTPPPAQYTPLPPSWHTPPPHKSVPLQQPITGPQNVYQPGIPQLRGPLTPFILNQYSSQQRIILRMVYALIDGQKSIEQIKAQLHLTPDAIDSALAVLRQHTIIIY